MKQLLRSKLFWLVALAVILVGGAFYFSSPGSAGVLWKISESGTWFLPILIVAALADSVNPCAISVLILTIAFLFNVGKLRREILKIGGAYILGLFLAYVAIGLGILQALHFFNIPNFFARAGATIFILWGALELINHFFPAFPVKLRIPQFAHRKMAEVMNKASVPAAFVLGALVGLCEFPCTGGPYLAVLAMLREQSEYMSGLGYLVLYNVVFVLPLLVILFISGNQTLLQKVDAWKKEQAGNMRVWGGIILIGLGILVFLL